MSSTNDSQLRKTVMAPWTSTACLGNFPPPALYKSRVKLPLLQTSSMPFFLRRPRRSRFQIRILRIDLRSRGADLLVQLPIFLLAISRAIAYCLALGAGLERLLWICFWSIAACAFVGWRQ